MNETTPSTNETTPFVTPPSWLPSFFNAGNWYWIIGGDETQVHSSKRARLVPADDPEFVAWKGSGGRLPTRIATIQELDQVLTQSFPAGSLRTYNPYARFNKQNGGIIITSLSPARFATDTLSRNSINSGYDYLQANPGATLQWKMMDGSFTTLNKTAMEKLMNTAVGFTATIFQQEQANNEDIADGSITTLAQIDATYAAISNTFP